MKYLPLLTTVLISAAAALSGPGQAFLAAHPTIALIIASLFQVIHAALPSVKE